MIQRADDGFYASGAASSQSIANVSRSNDGPFDAARKRSRIGHPIGKDATTFATLDTNAVHGCTVVANVSTTQFRATEFEFVAGSMATTIGGWIFLGCICIGTNITTVVHVIPIAGLAFDGNSDATITNRNRRFTIARFTQQKFSAIQSIHDTKARAIDTFAATSAIVASTFARLAQLTLHIWSHPTVSEGPEQEFMQERNYDKKRYLKCSIVGRGMRKGGEKIMQIHT